MSEDIIIEKLQKIFYECDKHLLRINSSYTELKTIMPLSEERYVNLNEEEIKSLDQFLLVSKKG